MAKDMVRLGVTLLLICGIAGLGLAVVYAQTNPVIQQRAKDDLIAAAKAAIPGADTITEQSKDGNTYWLGQTGSATVGAAMRVVATGYNKSDPIQMMVGMDTKGNVVSVSIVSINETPGIGMKVKDKAFLSQFPGKTDPSSVDKVSGATYSSQAVKSGVGRAMEFLAPIVAPKLVEAPVDISKIPDGTYKGTADGLMGPIEVSVTVAGGKITGVAVVSNKETPVVADGAFKQVPQAIVSQQKVEVDTVSGATFASKGIIQAVKNALAGAQTK